MAVELLHDEGSPNPGICPQSSGSDPLPNRQNQACVSTACPLPAGSAAHAEPHSVRERPWQGRGCAGWDVGSGGSCSPTSREEQEHPPASPLTYSCDGSTSKAGGTQGEQRCGGSCVGTVLPCPLPRLSIHHLQQCSKHMVKKAFLERAGLSSDVFSVSSVYWWLCFPATKPRRGMEPHGLLKGCS